MIGGGCSWFAVKLVDGTGGRSGKLEYALNHKCVGDALRQLHEITEVKYYSSVRRLKGESKPRYIYRYSYKTVRSDIWKNMMISIVSEQDNKNTTIINHGTSSTPEAYMRVEMSGVGDERGIMYTVEDKVGEVCSITNIAEILDEICDGYKRCTRSEIINKKGQSL